jgi:hypothetical protein
MSDFKLALETDSNNPIAGDTYLDESGQPVIIGDDIGDQEDYSQMILQRVYCKLQIAVGEWYLDQRQGVPWYGRILAKGITAPAIKRIVKLAIESVPGVQSVDTISVTLNKTNRTATIRFSGTTDTGSVVTNEQLDKPFIIGGENV